MFICGKNLINENDSIFCIRNSYLNFTNIKNNKYILNTAKFYNYSLFVTNDNNNNLYGSGINDKGQLGYVVSQSHNNNLVQNINGLY